MKKKFSNSNFVNQRDVSFPTNEKKGCAHGVLKGSSFLELMGKKCVVDFCMFERAPFSTTSTMVQSSAYLCVFFRVVVC
jgi:hypothetical protein